MTNGYSQIPFKTLSMWNEEKPASSLVVFEGKALFATAGKAWFVKLYIIAQLSKTCSVTQGMWKQ